MALVHRKRRPLDRTVDHLRDTRLIVMATEGEQTEKQYFAMFRSSRIQVRVIPSDGGLSSPRHVLERLDAYRNEFQIGGDDELWLMIDVDRWGDRNLSQVCSAARRKGYRLAVSNPCFELWIYLHFLDLTGAAMECSWYEQQIRAHHGSYNKSNLAVDALKPLAGDAIGRARDAANEGHLWPASAGTDVFRVVEQVHNLENG
ncbi:MAG TPA: RloB family protein [Blastocatellia bacterium]